MGLVDIFLDDANVKKILLCVMGFVFVLISGLRWESGTDWVNYINYFNGNSSFNDFFKVDDFEVGYRLLNYVVKVFSDKYTALLLALAFLSIIPKLWSFTNFKYFLVILFGYYCVFEADIFAVRQCIALGFSAIGIYFIVKRQLYGFLLMILIGMLFHWTILGFIPAYFLYGLKNFRTIGMVLIVIALAAWLMNLQQVIFNLALSKFSSVDPDSKLGSQLFLYSQQSDDFDQLSKLGVLSRVVMILYFWALSIFKPEDKLLNGFLNIYIVGFVIYVVLGASFIVFVRLSWYYTYIEIFLIAYSLSFFKTRFDRCLVYFVFTLYFAARLNQVITSQADLKVPLYFIWDNSHRTFNNE